MRKAETHSTSAIARCSEVSAWRTKSGAEMRTSAEASSATTTAEVTATTAEVTAAATESTTTIVPSCKYGWTERKESRAHEAKYSFRLHRVRSRHRDLGAIARPLGFRMLPKSCRLLPLWSERPTRQIGSQPIVSKIG